jgi:hypothetical protein
MLEDAAEDVLELALALGPLGADRLELALLALVDLAPTTSLPLAPFAVIARALALSASGRCCGPGKRLWLLLARGGRPLAPLVEDASKLDVLEVLGLLGLRLGELLPESGRMRIALVR